MTQGYQVPGKPHLPKAYPEKGFTTGKVNESKFLRKRFYCSGTMFRCQMPHCTHTGPAGWNICPDCGGHFTAKRVPCTHQSTKKGWVWCPVCGGHLTVRFGGPYTQPQQAALLNKMLGLTDLREVDT